MKNLLIITLAFVIGLNFTTIKNYVLTEVNRANKIQYCNDMYMGNDFKINACIMK